MKKILASLLSFIVVFSFAACNKDNTEIPTEAPTEAATHAHEEIIPDTVPEGSEADIQVRAAVKEYLDTIIACDFDKIKENLHADDAWLFNFESEDQMKFYNAIFPRVKYSFEYVAEHEGVYGVMTQITSPDMAEVYGTIITDYIDQRTEIGSVELDTTDVMIDLVTDPDISLREQSLFIYVEYIDGEYIVRCDAWLANELTGGAPEVSDELSNTLNEAVGALEE